tara:strand:+ start:1444 stop:1689 length:246 start_codon:yes stop_codon:yes gene_type:complete
MPLSNIKHTVDIIFTPEEIKEILIEKASQLCSTNKMIFNNISINWKIRPGTQDIHTSEDVMIRINKKDIPGFKLHFKSEAS